MNYLKKYKNLLLFLCIIFLISIIAGLILGFNQTKELKDSLAYGLSDIKNILLNTKANNIFNHLICLIILSFLSSTFIGFILSIIYLFYNGFCIGFNIYCFTLTHHFKGFFFTLSYNIIFKLLFILLFLFLLIKLYNLSKTCLSYYLYRQAHIKKLIKKNYLAITIIIFLITINDIILYFNSTSILKILTNML